MKACRRQWAMINNVFNSDFFYTYTHTQQFPVSNKYIMMKIQWKSIKMNKIKWKWDVERRIKNDNRE